MNRQFNNANKVLEADTKELRISIIHEAAAASGTSICIRKSPSMVRMNIERMLEESYCPERILQLLMNCVLAGMNFVFGGEPGAGKTECAKFFMQFIPREERVITIEDSLEIHYRDINPGADAVELRVRKLPDRIQNMMSDARDAERMENRIYRYVNVGILIRCVRQPDGKIRRYMDQLCFYSREQYENRIYMILEDGELLSEELPPAIVRRLGQAGIEDPFCCAHWQRYRREGK